ncbi:MAG: glycosyltransferase family 39 protein [Bacteroidota bacterium]
MKKIPYILGICALFKLTIHLIANGNYGFHRDELLHLSVSEHLAWGYWEFPPLIAFIGRLSTTIFGYSLEGMRLFPTLAGMAILFLTVAMARSMGGKWRSVLLAAVCVLAFLPYYRNHTLFQPVAFDQFFWALAFFFLIRLVDTSKDKFLLYAGLAAGLGLLNKYTMAFWIVGVAIGLLSYEKARFFRYPKTYLAAAIALLVFLPNLWWQWANGFPVLGHLNTLSSSHLAENTIGDFVLDQVILIATFNVSLIGLWFSFRRSKYRWIGMSTLLVFVSMMLLKAKSYYVFPIYSVLFACGAVQLEHWLEKTKATWSYIVAASILLPFVYFIPEVAPVLPIEQYVDYKGIKNPEVWKELEGDYADMHGWEEQVALVDSFYNSLPADIQQKTVIWAENYGEAGAIKILGKAYSLPNPISRHGTFWAWGYGKPDAEVWISIGNETESVQAVFSDVQLVRRMTHPYAIAEEQNIPVFICRNPKVNISEWWAAYEDFVFD